MGHNILSCVEHGFQGNFLRAYEVAQKYDLKFVFGVEAYWVDDTNDEEHTHPNAHICLFARNETGRREITGTLSHAQEYTFWRVPRIGLDRLLMLSPENVFVTTACVAYWGRVDKESGHVNWHPNHIENFKKLRGHFGESIMLEVQAHDSTWQREINTMILELAESTHTKIIAGLDSHYIFPEQSEERRTLREESGISFGEDDYELDTGVYEDYPDEKTLTERFKIQGVLDNSQIADAINNTDIFLEFDDLVFSREKKLSSIYKEETQEQRNERYRKLLRNSWGKYKDTINPEDKQKYLDAIAYEADTITSTGFSDYFIINHSVIDEGKAMGAKITLTSRGSSSSFFTNTLLGLSTIDRITLPVELYPERFVSRERLLAGQLPDVDINTSDQNILERAQKKVVGEGHAFPMVAYGTLRDKSAFRMYARAKGLSIDIQNAISKQIEDYERELKYTDEDEKDTVDIADFVDAQYMSYIEESEPYRGIIVSKAKAPCSYLLYDGDIRSEIGLMRIISTGKNKGFTMCTVIDGYTADDFGYLKNDLLQVDTVRLSDTAYKEAGLVQPTSKDLIELTANDKPTWEIYSRGATLGINQCEKQQAAMKLMTYKPQNIAELSAFVAAIRPGFKSMVGKFLTRQHFEYGIPAIDKLLQGKYMKSSWLLYQEQIMKILSFAGFPMDSTYGIVKAISKKKADKIMKIKPEFIEGFKKRVIEEDGISEEIASSSAEATWHIIEDSSAYSFNASHSIAVALDGLYCAYIKGNYPLAFYKALLTIYQDKKAKDKIAAVKDEMLKHFQIRTVPCKFRQDNRSFLVNKDNNTVSDALSSMKGVSNSVAVEMYKSKDRKFNSFVDVLYWMNTATSVNTAVQETLIRTNYFEEFGHKRQLLSIYNEFYNGPSKFSKAHIEKTQQARLDSLREKEKGIMCLELEKEGILEITEQLRFETSVWGSPLSLYRDYEALYTVIDINVRPRTPIVTFYSAQTGNIGKMRIRKNDLSKKPLENGDTIIIKSFERRDGGRFINGAFQSDGTKEVWVKAYDYAYQENK